MKRFITVSVIAALFLSGCSSREAVTQNVQQPGGRIKVVTSFYPLYEIAKRVGGDYIDLKNLVPAGAEPHDYELTPKDIASITESQILLVNGGGMEPWLDKLLSDLAQQSPVRVLDESKLFESAGVGSQHDPHIWLDPSQYMQEVSEFEKTISSLDPLHKEYYSLQAKNFIAQLTDLDEKFKQGLQNCALRDFVTNHAAFAYLSKRYNLNMIAIAGFSPDAEPSIKTLASLVDVINQKKIHYILTESLVSPKIAEVLANETGAKTLVLNPLEGLTSEQMTSGQNYLTVMQQNLKNLQTALECK